MVCCLQHIFLYAFRIRNCLVFFTFIYVFSRTVQVVIVIDIMKRGIQHDSVNLEDDTSLQDNETMKIMGCFLEAFDESWILVWWGGGSFYIYLGIF